MRPIRLLLIYCAVVFPGGALLAPWIYRLARGAAGLGAIFSGLANVPFPRVLDRCLLGLALVCLWPLLRGGGAQSWQDLGFVPQGQTVRQVLLGLALGWASLAAVALLALACGARSFVPNHSAAEVGRHLVNATLAAVIVAVLEELVFRGALFGLLRQAMSWPFALIISSAVYSSVHFIKQAAASGPVQWTSGLALLWQMFAHPPPLIPAFLTLLVAGSLLALFYQRTGALYLSIGLHAGWIFWLKFYRFLLQPSGGNPCFWGGDNLIDGWLSFIVLTLVLMLAWRRKPNPKTTTSA